MESVLFYLALIRHQMLSLSQDLPRLGPSDLWRPLHLLLVGANEAVAILEPGAIHDVPQGPIHR